MKHWLLTALMILTVSLFLFLKATGRIRMSDLNPVSALGLKLVLFVVSAGFFAVSLIKLLYMLVGYDSTPFSIALYAAAIALACVVSFATTAWLTKD